MLPKYPIYIISKCRSQSRLTAKALDEMNVPYKIVVEPQEYDEYAAVIKDNCILSLPFSNLGQGSIPARNWVWEHSLEAGDKWHWILDDNIRYFFRLHQNKKYLAKTGGIFRAAEAFCERYLNIAIAGLEYEKFVPRKKTIAPFRLNARIYSCLLIRNDLHFRWRGRYNEDTDLSLRVLKAGWCTVLFHAFLCGKQTTMTMKGGNTDELYKGDGRLRMAQSLVKQHPDVAKIVYRYGRWHHEVNYKPFKNNKLVSRPNIDIHHGNDEFGMLLTSNLDTS